MKLKYILLFLLFVPSVVFATNKTIFKIDNATGSPLEEISVNINMDNKEEFSALTLKVYYDNSKLEYVSSKLLGLKNAAIKSSDYNDKKGIVALYGISIDKDNLMNDNGDILKINFKIKDNAQGDTPLTIEVVDFKQDDNISYEYEIQNSNVHINTTKSDNNSSNSDDHNSNSFLNNFTTDKTITINGSNNNENEPIAIIGNNDEFYESGNEESLENDVLNEENNDNSKISTDNKKVQQLDVTDKHYKDDKNFKLLSLVAPFLIFSALLFFVIIFIVARKKRK